MSQSLKNTKKSSAAPTPLAQPLPWRAERQGRNEAVSAERPRQRTSGVAPTPPLAERAAQR